MTEARPNCETCDGDGEMTCPCCGQEMRCPVCDGSGVVDSDTQDTGAESP